MRVFGMVTTAGSNRYTAYAIKTFLDTTPLEPADRVFLIDNDGAYAQETDPRVSVIRNQSPMGFAANVNAIMSIAGESKADLYFLNNDLIFTSRWIDPLMVDERALLSPVTNFHFQHRSGQLTCDRFMDLEQYLGRESDLNAIALQHYANNIGYSPSLSLWFCCVKIPYSVYSLVGALDERFGPGGGEDHDYCLRCHLAGIPVAYVRQSFVLHFMGKSTWRGPETLEQRHQREQIYERVFREKWGEALFQLMIKQNEALLSRDAEARAAYLRYDYGAVVRKLVPRQQRGS